MRTSFKYDFDRNWKPMLLYFFCVVIYLMFHFLYILLHYLEGKGLNLKDLRIYQQICNEKTQASIIMVGILYTFFQMLQMS